MNNPDNNTRLCKNKNCNKPLPEGYKHKYCEACRNKHIHTAKKAGKWAAGIVTTFAAFFFLRNSAGEEEDPPEEEE